MCVVEDSGAGLTQLPPHHTIGLGKRKDAVEGEGEIDPIRIRVVVGLPTCVVGCRQFSSSRIRGGDRVIELGGERVVILFNL